MEEEFINEMDEINEIDEQDVEEKIQLLMGDIDELIYEQNKRKIPHFVHQAEKYLNSDEDDINDEDSPFFTLIIYTINTEGAIPFIQYLLFKNNEEDLEFVEVKKKQYVSIMSQSEAILNEITKAFKLMSAFQYKGYTRIENTSYLFFELGSIDCHILFSINDLWFVLLDEIVNETKTTIAINQKVKNFFKNNIELCLLLDENESCYEIPTVAFAGYRKKQLEFCGTFGNPPLSFSSNQYLFKDYDSACEDAYNAALKNGDKNYGGIVRFAILFGDTEYVFLNDTSKNDSSKDTCVVNRGDNVFHFFLKNYEQQYPLTIHYMNDSNNII